MKVSTEFAFAKELKATRSSRPRWHRVYYLLALFDVLVVLTSLYLGHQIMGIYARSVVENQEWAQRRTDYSELGLLAGAVNAPGNDVFDTHDVEAESAKMHAALHIFDRRLASLREDMRAEESQAQLAPIYREIGATLEDMDAIQVAVDGMTAEANLIFSYFREGQPDLAGKRMATMDRKYSRVLQGLARLHGDVGVIQSKVFDRQQAAAASLHKFEYAIAAFICLMVSAAVVYGHKIKDEMESDTQKLEGLVRERTAELAEVNEGLQAEIAERKRGERRLKNSGEQLRALSAHLQSIREEERTHIAREIHDELGQLLTGLIIDLSWLEDNLGRERAGAPLLDKTRSMLQLADQVIDAVRRIATELRPGLLDDFGLAAAVEWYTQEFQKRTGIRCDLSSTLEGSLLSPDCSIVVFRVLQEALTNVARHAKASKVAILLEEDDRHLILQVRDNGIGVPENVLPDSKSLGILGMRERVFSLRGEFDISSAQGKGTSVTARIPLPSCQP